MDVNSNPKPSFFMNMVKKMSLFAHFQGMDRVFHFDSDNHPGSFFWLSKIKNTRIQKVPFTKLQFIRFLILR